MDFGSVDLPALALALAIAAIIASALMWSERAGATRRWWSVATSLAIVLVAISLFEIMREHPRETHVAAPILGAGFPAFGTALLLKPTHRMRPWWRWMLLVVAAFLLLFAGLLLGATIVPRFLPL